MDEPTNADEVIDPGQLPPVPEDQDLDEPQQHVPPSVAEPDPDPEWELDPLYAQPAGSQETFEERRRRCDQQETIQARRVHPVVPITEPAEEHRNKRMRRSQEEDLPIDTDLLVLDDTMDVNSLNNLVAGWTFDKATGEFVLGETKDYWNFEDGFLVRNHVWSRNSTFTSEEAPLPVAAEELQSTTGLTLPNGSRQVFVNSKQTYCTQLARINGLARLSSRSQRKQRTANTASRTSSTTAGRCDAVGIFGLPVQHQRRSQHHPMLMRRSSPRKIASPSWKERKVNSVRSSRMVFGRWNCIHTTSLQIAFFEQDGFSLGALEQEVNKEQRHVSFSKGSTTQISLKANWRPAVPLCAEQLDKPCWPSHAMKTGKSGWVTWQQRSYKAIHNPANCGQSFLRMPAKC